MTEEKLYDIQLRKSFSESSRRKKAPHAIKAVRDFVAKNTRSENVILGTGVNELVWSRGVSHPPSKIRIKVKKDGDKVFADLISAEPEKEAVKTEDKTKSEEQPKKDEEKKA
ncbi:MAG: 60S ribosomal protein L31 [Candidatus Aenigmarchaeota archaeon]|nr:60S ribosomal protein L31 [Candidatus Aenigmarchaeota archaeon]